MRARAGRRERKGVSDGNTARMTDVVGPLKSAASAVLPLTGATSIQDITTILQRRSASDESDCWMGVPVPAVLLPSCVRTVRENSALTLSRLPSTETGSYADSLSLLVFLHTVSPLFNAHSVSAHSCANAQIDLLGKQITARRMRKCQWRRKVWVEYVNTAPSESVFGGHGACPQRERRQRREQEPARGRCISERNVLGRIDIG